VRGNLAALRSALAGGHAEPLHVTGGWAAVVRLPRTRTEEEWLIALLEQDGVLADPGRLYGFDQDGYAVLSLLPPPPIFREGISRMTARLAGS
jgi:aspartate/methionine/tyrosine aminotransferase